MESSAAEISGKIALLAQRLKSEPDLAPRVKKRIFQKIGKLKSDLAALGATYIEAPASSNDNKILSSAENADADEEDNRGSADGPSEQDGEAAPAPAAAVEEEDAPPAKKAKLLSGDSAVTKVQLSKKEHKALVHFVVKQLNEFAQKKQLVKAKQLVKQFTKKKGLQLDVHCYSNLLNVYVRCNDLTGASRILDEMKLNNVSPNIVTYTTLLKGYCELGQQSKAECLYKEMIDSKQHNLRSLSTFLRGCLRTGSVSSALLIFQRTSTLLQSSMEEEDRWQDTAIMEPLMSLLCRALRLDEAAQLVLDYLHSLGSKTSGGLRALESAGLYSLLARAAILLGRGEDARKYLSLAHSMLQSTAHLQLTERMKARFAQSADQPDESHDSARLFQSHKHAQLTEEVGELEDYTSAFFSAVSGHSSQSSMSPPSLSPALSVEQLARNEYEARLSHMLWFGYDGQGGVSDPSPPSSSSSSCSSSARLAHALTRALQEKAGLSPTASGTANCLAECIQADGRLDLDRLFPSLAGQPVYLEIGAGHGDWIVAQAAHDRSVRTASRWLASELRFDRAHDIFCKHFFSLRTVPSLWAAAAPPSASPWDNLAVLGGDAQHLVTHRLPLASLAGVFINYPQPPERSGSAASQGQHLLTPAFLLAVRELLAERGRLTLLTDNLPYALQLAKSLVEGPFSKHPFGDAAVMESAECQVQEVVRDEHRRHTVTVYRGAPGMDCGHRVAEQSYFDRLWAHGQKKRRWFFCVEKKEWLRNDQQTA